jgi:hypothetical protein
MLGRGKAMFAGLDLPALGYRVTENVSTELAMHVMRQVGKGERTRSNSVGWFCFRRDDCCVSGRPQVNKPERAPKAVWAPAMARRNRCS